MNIANDRLSGETHQEGADLLCLDTTSQRHAAWETGISHAALAKNDVLLVFRHPTTPGSF